MKVLSVKEPWAGLILSGLKQIEKPSLENTRIGARLPFTVAGVTPNGP